MGKTLDVLLGRSFKPSKFKALVNLSISRLAILKNQKQTRCSISRSDVVQLLNIGEHERALIRVEQVIRECNMLDVYAMIEGYCILLSERVKVIEHDKVCPDELKEAISSLIFAASRCGDFPELREIRKVFASRYGKEFALRATELRNNCGVNPKLIQKLSTRQPSLESRTMVLKEIADEKGIVLQLPSMAAEEKTNEKKENQPEFVPIPSLGMDRANIAENLKNLTEAMDKVEDFGGSVNMRKQYRHVADAAQEAFLSATYAAAAARAAVELSRSIPRSPDNPNDPLNGRKQVFSSNYELTSRGKTNEETFSGEIEDRVLEIVKAQPIDKYSLDSEDDEETVENEGPQTTHIRQMDTRSYGSTTALEALEKDEQLQLVKYTGTNSETVSERFNTVSIEDQQEEIGGGLPYYSQKPAPSSIQGDLKTDYKVQSSTGPAAKRAHWLTSKKNLMSVRTRR